MDATFKFTPTPSEVNSALRAVRKSANRSAFSSGQLVAHFFLIVGVPLVVATVFFERAADEIFVVAGLFLILSVVVPRVVKAGDLTAPFTVENEVRLTDDGVRQQTRVGTTQWPWASLRRLHPLDGQLVLEFEDWSWVALPNRLWDDPTDRGHFVLDLRERAPNLAPEPVDQVDSPFTLTNVAAGLGAADAFVLALTLIVPAVLQSSMIARLGPGHSLGLTFALALALAVGAYFPLRAGMRRLARTNRPLELVVANILIWAIPILLLLVFLQRGS